ncbi:Integral membrane protein (PIN domain superfamily) [Legionella moravica]|uniref:Integral membrane protein (PIN domain superfamily) n=1 Tax=Legionella moravica TaxID=39962 RepID=A0A378JWI3_9GAMM|nr:hypothetical protein [Legionella moravica]KTD33479.1 Integral membrane protein (PIN domain superfamily) [Legionella moravica]STX61852.1 Integral membrane protein (PIN domain superfamily) [Legionella moravica]
MTTLFLATVIGWYLVIVSLYSLFQYEQLKSVAAEIMGQRGLFFVLAIMTLILGLLLVTSHNIWVMSWPVVITIFSWLVLISGLIRMFCPDTANKMRQSFLNNPVKMKIAAVVSLLVGLFLLFHVYYPLI